MNPYLNSTSRTNMLLQYAGSTIAEPSSASFFRLQPSNEEMSQKAVPALSLLETRAYYSDNRQKGAFQKRQEGPREKYMSLP